MLESQHEHIIPNDVLIVDDELSNLQLLSDLLDREGYQVRPTNNPKLAIDSAIKHPPKLILLDVKMPGIDGYEVCKRLKQDERTRYIPILFVSALQDIDDRIKGFQAGGVDFISKPFQEEEVLARVRTHMDLHRMQLNLETLVLERTSQLIKSEAKYRGLVDNSIVGVFTSTLDGRFLFTNDAMAQMFDFDSCEEMIKKGPIEHWKDRKDRERFLGELQKNGQVTNFEIQIITNAGQEKTVLFSAHLDGDQITGMMMDITERKQTEDNLQKAYTEIEQLQKQLQAESTYLQEEIKLEHNFENIIGQSEALKYILHRVEQVAPQDSSVLIQGETGTGKELIARALHRLSKCSKRPLVKVNCAALPAELIESELFGREKGAFTGATTTTVGRFELAKGTTLFLDEIGELPLALQAKLLRVIESGEFERLGSSRTIHSNARIVAATNRNLEQEVRKKHFREDLLYRLKVYPITVPPLRDRLEDIPLIVNSFVKFFARKMGKASYIEVPQKSMQALLSYHWPGNIRELKHAVEGAMISLQGKKLNFDLPKTVNVAATKFKSLEEMERDYILEVLKAENWKIEGEDSASSILGMPPSTLRSRMKKLGLKRP